MQKRFFLALVLSFLVLFVWQGFITKPQPQTPAPIVVKSPELQAPEPQKPEPEKLTQFTVGTADLETVLVEETASIERAILKNYKNHAFSLKNGLYMGGGLTFSNKQVVDNKRVTFTYQDEQKRVGKELTLSDSGYEIKLIISVENISAQPLKFSFPLSLGTLNLQPVGQDVFRGITVSQAEKILYPAVNKNNVFSSVKFLSLRDSYFCAIIEPKENNYSASLKNSGKETEVILQSPELSLAPGQKLTQEFTVFIGPQDLKLLSKTNPDWQAIVYFGKLDAIAHLLLKSLTGLNAVTHNWGIAIILLSIIIYIILFPLTRQQLNSMREMQRIQPKVEELRCKYKDDPMRLQKETMALYKEHKINPLGGCLPMLLQIPVFFSFYLVLARSIQLKGAGFLWIRDLSEPDKIAVLSTQLPFLGNEVNLLPVLMVIASFFQQKASSAQMAATPEAAQQQKIMMFVFPLMFFFFFYHMPSGLVLYWFTNTVLTVVQQSLIMKKK